MFGLGSADLESFALAAARVVPAIATFPGFGGGSLPAPFRVTLGLFVSLLIWFGLSEVEPAPSPYGFALRVVEQLLLGLAMGLLAAMPFRAAESAGRLSDIARGTNLADIVAAETGERVSPTAQLYLRLSALWFLCSGAYRVFLFGLADTFQRLPFDGDLRAQPALDRVIATSSAVLEGAMALFFPTAAALLLADLSLGALGRSAPQLGLQTTLMPVRAVLGAFVTLVTLGLLMTFFDSSFRGLLFGV